MGLYFYPSAIVDGKLGGKRYSIKYSTIKVALIDHIVISCNTEDKDDLVSLLRLHDKQERVIVGLPGVDIVVIPVNYYFDQLKGFADPLDRP